jgi:uracil-DNA glycosylase family 4
MQFDLNCKQCPRLANFLDKVSQSNPGYYCRPVAPFGAINPQFLIVGLAPGMHGANRTGRPFTGDYAGILLYETLNKFGFSSSSESISLKDELQLYGVRITNAVKCLPPENKPTTHEIKQCNNYLASEIKQINNKLIILALGKIAHEAV